MHFQAGGDSSWAPRGTAMLLLYWGPRLAIALADLFISLLSPQVDAYSPRSHLLGFSPIVSGQRAGLASKGAALLVGGRDSKPEL